MRRALLALALLTVAAPAGATSVGVSYLVPLEGEGGFGLMAQMGFRVLPKLAITGGAGYQEIGWAADHPAARDAKAPWVQTGSIRGDVGVEYDLWQAKFATLSVLGGVGILVPLQATLLDAAPSDLAAASPGVELSEFGEPEASVGGIGGAGLGVSVPAGKVVVDLEGRYVRAFSSASFDYQERTGVDTFLAQSAGPDLYFSGFELSLTVSF